jgi:hypothetical protein
MLDGMRRDEIRDALGPGEPCARHPQCGEHGFGPSDSFYSIGSLGSGPAEQAPLLIVGFDHNGRVTRAWNLRTTTKMTTGYAARSPR